MKKFFAMLLTFAMLLSTAVLGVSAAGIATFEACGEQSIEWDKDAAANITLDGSLDDWQNAGYDLNEITLDNMVPFDHLNNNTMPTDFSVSTYYVADANWLYIGFFIVDDDVKAPTEKEPHLYQTGDCFQIAIDLNAECEKMLTEDPSYFDSINADTESIFYSFAYPGDGEELVFMAQNITGTTDLEARAESLGHNGVKGMASKTEQGWCAEFAFSWDMLFDDFFYKSFVPGDYEIKIDENNPLKIGASICYLNSNGAAPQGAYGTFKSYDCKTNEDKGGHGIDPTDNGLYLMLDYEPGMVLNCSGIRTPGQGDDESGSGNDDAANFTDMSKLENFGSGKHGSYFSASDCKANYKDGYIQFTPNWGAKEAVKAKVDIAYMRMMLSCFDYPEGVTSNSDKQAMIPNGGDMNYGVVVLKTKRNDVAKDQLFYVDYQIGSAWGGMQTPLEKQVDSADGYEYLVFDLSERTDFVDGCINTLQFVWVEDNASDELANASMELHGIYLYNTVDDAVSALNLTVTDLPDKPAESDPDDDTDDGDDDGTKAPSGSETETQSANKGGCGSVVGVSAAAVVMMAAAAAVVLKKKED